MSPLPDLDTMAIGPIVFWNFLDNSSDAELDPTEVLDHGDINSWETYDNGVEGTMWNPTSNRNCNFRVKADGWFITWFDRTNEYIQHTGTGNPPSGYWDVLYNLRSHGGGTNPLPDTTLGERINSLRQRLSNSSSATFSHSDTGMYCYEFPNANTFTMAYEQHSRTGGNYNRYAFDGGMSYSSNVTRFYHSVFGSGYSDNGNVDSNFAGIKLFNTPEYGSECGSIDAISNNLMPSAGTVYNNHGGVDGSYYNHAHGKMTHFVMYSV